MRWLSISQRSSLLSSALVDRDAKVVSMAQELLISVWLRKCSDNDVLKLLKALDVATHEVRPFRHDLGSVFVSGSAFMLQLQHTCLAPFHSQVAAQRVMSVFLSDETTTSLVALAAKSWSTEAPQQLESIFCLRSLLQRLSTRVSEGDAAASDEFDQESLPSRDLCPGPGRSR